MECNVNLIVLDITLIALFVIYVAAILWLDR